MRSGWWSDMRAAMVILTVCGLAFAAFAVAVVAMVGCIAGVIKYSVAGEWWWAAACFVGLAGTSGVGLAMFALCVTFPGNYYFRP